MVAVVEAVESLEPQVVLEVEVVEQVPLVPLAVGVMPLVLAVIQPLKGQLLETVLEAVAEQAEVTVVMVWHLKSAGPLNMAEGVEALRTAPLELLQHREPEVYSVLAAVVLVAVKVVRLVALVVFGASMMPQLMAETLVPQAEEVQVA